MWLNKIATAPDPEVKRNIIPILRFLSNEIVRGFPRDLLDKIENFDPKAIEDLERSLPPPPEDQSSGDVNEMEFISEERRAGDESQ